MATLTGHDMQGVTQLVKEISGRSDHRVVSVEGVEAYNHGVRVTLSVELATRVKGGTVGDYDEGGDGS